MKNKINLKGIVIHSATLFGVGNIPFMPGTWGTLATVPLCYFMLQLGPLLYMLITLALSIYAIWAADLYEQQAGTHDAKQIVIDELAGFLVTMAWMPLTWQSLLIGFVIFRLLDIVKPFPISYFDKKVPKGLGVVADDVVAGIIGNVILQIIFTNTSWLGSQLLN